MFLGMTWSAWTLLLTMLCLSGSAVLIWYWARKEGQFSDVEAVKYRMLDDDET
ncbi:cbb3-type cytochrome oxidase assembly protein [Brevibacillus dissolubilis]|uniref:cbb3-type cytochrome oxidase assembly protein n=1 Tax=Brevibacillus dissolubilis TaxID=1844116 RepID=UPI001C3F43C0|nr:cbb3-type cytochrome oxidase assembly protein [Brevibacillus dissolubilis]